MASGRYGISIQTLPLVEGWLVMLSLLTVEDIHYVAVNNWYIGRILIHCLVLVFQAIWNIFWMHGTSGEVHNAFQLFLLALLPKSFREATGKSPTS